MRTFSMGSAALAGLLTVAACDGAASDGSLDGPWRAARDTLGDTVVVRTLSGSEWGAARLVEDLRIGQVDGADHEIFGRIAALAVSPAGAILVYDAQAIALRHYDADGAYLGTIGRAGSGPGEYQNVAGLAALDDGRIVVNDFGNGRFNIYTAEHELAATWLLHPAVAEMRPLHTHPGGSVFLHDQRYLQDLGGQELRRDEILVRLDTTGAPVDTTSLPNHQYRRRGLQVRTETRSIGTLIPFTPERGWSVTASGEIVAMMGDRYAVDVHRADGSVLRIARAVEAIPVSADERAAEQERITASFRRFVSNWSWDGPAIPNTKPPLSWLHTGRDGTIWVRIARPGIVISEGERTPDARTFVREPLVFDVFESDGRFLGQVHAPEALQLLPFPVLQRDQVWAVVQDGDGVNYVARFRVVPDG